MKRALVCLGIGVYFGVVLIKSEVVSWWRIQEELIHGAERQADLWQKG